MNMLMIDYFADLIWDQREYTDQYAKPDQFTAQDYYHCYFTTREDDDQCHTNVQDNADQFQFTTQNDQCHLTTEQ